jgi:hypothetical protein
MVNGLYAGAAEQPVPLVGFGYPRQILHFASTRRSLHVGTAENDNCTQLRSKAATTKSNDAVDDAADVPLS